MCYDRACKYQKYKSAYVSCLHNIKYISSDNCSCSVSDIMRRQVDLLASLPAFEETD